ELCLLAAMDDATGEVLAGAQFMERECAVGYLQLIMAMAAHHGLPWSIYMDHHGSLVRNDDHWSAQELRRGKQDPTQVGRVLEELNIEVITALTPQAKGRGGRLGGTFQGRLGLGARVGRGRTPAPPHPGLEEVPRPLHPPPP